MVLWWLVLVASAGSLLAMDDAFKKSESCIEASKAGVTVYRIPEIAHVLHSVTVEDIRYFFKEDFPTNNTIPTTNQDLTSDPEAWVLPFAPSIPSAYGFPSGRSFDFILQNNDNVDNFMIGGMTTLEKLGHAIHMQEMWHMIAKWYNRLDRDIDFAKICPCLEDEESNGIIEALEGFAVVARNGMPEINDLDAEDVIDQLKEKLDSNMIYKESNMIDEESNIVKRDAMRSFKDYWPITQRAKRDAMRSFKDYWPITQRAKRDAMRSFKDYWPITQRAKRDAMRSFKDYWPITQRARRDALRSFKDYWPITQRARRDAMRSFKDYWPITQRARRDAMRSFKDYWIRHGEDRAKREADASELDFNGMVPELKDSKSWYYWHNLRFKMMQDDEFMKNAAMYFFCKLNRLY